MLKSADRQPRAGLTPHVLMQLHYFSYTETSKLVSAVTINAQVPQKDSRIRLCVN